MLISLQLPNIFASFSQHHLDFLVVMFFTSRGCIHLFFWPESCGQEIDLGKEAAKSQALFLHLHQSINV